MLPLQPQQQSAKVLLRLQWECTFHLDPIFIAFFCINMQQFTSRLKLATCVYKLKIKHVMLHDLSAQDTINALRTDEFAQSVPL